MYVCCRVCAYVMASVCPCRIWLPCRQAGVMNGKRYIVGPALASILLVYVLVSLGQAAYRTSGDEHTGNHDNVVQLRPLSG